MVLCAELASGWLSGTDAMYWVTAKGVLRLGYHWALLIQHLFSKLNDDSDEGLALPALKERRCSWSCVPWVTRSGTVVRPLRIGLGARGAGGPGLCSPCRLQLWTDGFQPLRS